jgi:hypothetical protein
LQKGNLIPPHHCYLRYWLQPIQWQAQAQTALLDVVHPLTVSASGREITVSGRVETEDARAKVLAALGALDGVDALHDDLVLLPNVTPFAFAIEKRDGLTFAGHLPDLALAAQMTDALGTGVDLPIATGVPDRNWRDMAIRLAQATGRLLSGRLEISGQEISITGEVHQPWDLRAVETLFAELPEDYRAQIKLRALDDGKPYGVLITRDRRMGLQISGKVPPGFDAGVFEPLGPAQDFTLQEAPLPLPTRGFDAALAAAVSAFGAVPEGVLSVTADHISLSGGPLDQDQIGAVQRLAGILPQGYGLQLDLVPKGDELPLQVRALWDGQKMQLSGHVPRDFPEVDQADSDLTHAPYPDLSGWGAGLPPALAALRGLTRGELLYGDKTVLNGVAASPDALARALAGLDAPPAGEIRLADDGTPPAFVFAYDAAAHSEVTGKLPNGLTVADLAVGLGVPVLGQPRLSPNGRADRVLSVLSALQPLLPEVDVLTLRYGPQALTLDVQVTPGSDPRAWQRRLGLVPAKVSVQQTEMPTDGHLREHMLLRETQEARGGRWLPVMTFEPSADACAQHGPDLNRLAYRDGDFLPPDGSVWEIARLIAVARQCVIAGEVTLEIMAQARGTGSQILDRQLARRRAEALRHVLHQNGVPQARVRATGQAAQDGQADRIDLIWK